MELEALTLQVERMEELLREVLACGSCTNAGHFPPHSPNRSVHELCTLHHSAAAKEAEQFQQNVYAETPY